MQDKLRELEAEERELKLKLKRISLKIYREILKQLDA